MSAFAEYATSTAFQIRLSKNQARSLGAIYDREQARAKGARGGYHLGLSDSVLSELRRKGLVHPFSFQLTPEGVLVAQLCVHAGLIRAAEAGDRAEAA
jgi:hypothetical protein